MTVTRPKRLTTVVAEPMLMPTNAPPVQPVNLTPAPEDHAAAAPVPPQRPRVVEVKMDDLSDMRMRPRRVIVVK